MSSIELTNVSSGFNLGKINENFQEVERVINEELLHRVNADASSNELQTDIDANGNHLYNLPKPSTGGEPLRLKDLFGSPEELLQGPEIEHIVATEGQLVFNLATAYVPDSDSMYVFRNGILLRKTVEYIESGTQQITLVEIPNAGDVISFVPVAVSGVVSDNVSGQNIGLGTGIYDSKALNVLKFKSLIPGNNVSFTTATGSIRIDATSSSTTASNLGTDGFTPGVGVFKEKVSDDLKFKSLTAGSNVTISPTADTITISASLPSGSGEANTASSVGTGSSVVKDKVGTDLRFKSLKAGPNISLTNNADDITINATGGGGGGSQFVSVADFSADATGTTASDSAFNSAALVNGFVYVPKGTYKIDAPISTSATWWLAPDAIITGKASVNGLPDVSRLTGKLVHYENDVRRSIRLGSPAVWLENNYWRYSQSIAEVASVSRFSEIGILGASRTSDNPAQTMGSIGVAAYSVNDSTTPKEPAWGIYVNHQKVNGSGPSYGMEIDNVNRSATFNATPYNMGDGLSGDRSFNLWLTCGGNGEGLLGLGNPVSAAIGVAANPTPFNRGIIFPVGSVNVSINEVFTCFNGGRIAWYDYQGGTERLSGWVSSAGPVAGLDLTIRDQATNAVDEGVRLDGSSLTMRPYKNSTLSLGTASQKWKDVWFTNLRATTQGSVNYSFEENFSGTFGYYMSFRKDASNTWLNMYPDGTISMSGNSTTGNKLIVWTDGSIFAGHATASQAGFMVPNEGKFWLNGASKSSYITQSGGNIVLVKNGSVVATW